VEPRTSHQQAPSPDLGNVICSARPFLPRVSEAVRNAMRIGTLYRPDCRIAATAILIDVLDHFRLTARPLSVIATVFNPVMSGRIERDGMPTLEEAERDWFPRGCYSLAVGVGDRNPASGRDTWW
jgi:hypothetical protein